jgi:putative tricarboxylic transport membrane protein
LSRQNQISGLAFLVVAIFICMGSIKLSVGTIHNPGPGFFPLMAGAVLGVYSLILFLQSFRKIERDTRNPFWANVQGGFKMFWVLLTLLVYVIGMDYLGFFCSTILFLGFLLRIMGRQKWLLTIILSLLGALISYGIFQRWLDVQLPQGVFGF